MASLTLFIIKLNEKEKDLGHWGYLLPVVLVFLSAMMVSEVRYPSFKSLGLRSTTTFLKMVIAALFVGCLFDIARKDFVLRPAAVFHGVSALRLRPPAPVARVAAGNREEDDDEPEAEN